MTRITSRSASLRIAAPLLLGVCLAAPSLAQSAAHGVDLAAIDKSASPCTDFYQYANGGWLASHPIPADRASYGGFSELSDRNQAVLHEIVNQAVAGPPAPVGSVKRKIADFYRSGMNTALIDKEGAAPLAPEFARIAAVTDTASLQAEIAHLHSIGVGALFGFGVGADDKNSLQNVAQLSQGGLGLPDQSYYLKTDPKSVALRTAYTDHVAKMLVLLGDDPTTAATEAQTVLSLETSLAGASMTRVERRNPNATYNKMTLAEVNALTPGFSYQPFFRGVRRFQSRPDHCRSAEVLRPSRAAHGKHAHCRLENVFALASHQQHGPVPQRELCGGELRISRHDSQRRDPKSAALEAGTR